MSRYRLTRRAVADLSAIWDYSAEQWGQAQADRYIRQIRDACEALAEGQEHGQSAEHIRQDYRKLIVGRHLLFFRKLAEGGIEVVRVLHQRMDVEQHLEK